MSTLQQQPKTLALWYGIAKRLFQFCSCLLCRSGESRPLGPPKCTSFLAAPQKYLEWPYLQSLALSLGTKFPLKSLLSFYLRRGNYHFFLSVSNHFPQVSCIAGRSVYHCSTWEALLHLLFI